MDKWEDTVLSPERIAYLLNESVGNHQVWKAKKVAEHQAEISFKAGEDKGKQEGFDKVVEWVEQHRDGGYNLCVKAILEEWQAFLKGER